jgi:hypothetical protein
LEKKIVRNLLVAIFEHRQPFQTDFQFGTMINECATPEQGAPGTSGTWWTLPGSEKHTPPGTNLCLRATNDLLPLKQLSEEEAKTLSPNEAFEKYKKEILDNLSSEKQKVANELEKASIKMIRLLSVIANSR